MGDVVKIAAKTALIVVITGAILALFATVQIPSIDFSVLTTGLGVALAVIHHWIPISTVIIPAAIVMLSIQLAIIVFEFAMIAVRWIMKVNE